MERTYLFQLKDKQTNETENIYGVNKNDVKTEFLCYIGRWTWIDSSYFEPVDFC